MTQALNLALFANRLNTSGQASNAGLQNSSITVTAGTGLTGGGAIALGGSTTISINNVAVANGGTGRATLAANSVLIGNGTGGINAVAPSTSGNVLTSNGTAWISQTQAVIGVGQTWQNQSGVKSVNTTYTNTTGKPIMVSISQASTGQQNIYINGNYLAQISQLSNTSGGFTFIVPNGNDYRIDTNTPSYWWELR
jgi:hypothetical protein